MIRGLATSVVLLQGCGGLSFPRGLAPIEGITLSGRSVDARACAACHPKQHAQWSTSRHAVASTNPVYTASLQDASPRGWCANCHGPRATDRQAGIDCAVCHVRDDAVLVSSREAKTDAARAAHPVRVEPMLAEPRFCAGCHQFDTPDPDRESSAPNGFFSGHPMQDTFGEWQRAKVDQDCQDCHMDEAGHRFPGAHTPDLVRSAVDVQITRHDRGIRAVLTSRDIGHDLPTGDPFRRLVFRLCETATCAGPQHKTVLMRRFDEDFRPIDDQTIQTGVPRVLELPDGPFIRWQLDYFYGEPRFEPGLPDDEVGFTITSGPVPP